MEQTSLIRQSGDRKQLEEIGENFLLHVIVGNKCIFVSLEVSTEIAADALYSEKQRFMVTVCYK